MGLIYPLDFRAYEIEIRELWLDVFIHEINQLNNYGFLHRDTKRPSNISGLAFDNILMNQTGLRLIDVGISALKTQVRERFFSKILEIENKEIVAFKAYFLD